MTQEEYEQRHAELSADLEALEAKYLTERGWVRTCSNIGGMWLWKGTLRGESFQVSRSTAIHFQRIEDSSDDEEDEDEG